MKQYRGHIAFLFTVLLLLGSGCSLLGSKKFHFLYENDTTVASISREGANSPVKLFFTHQFPTDFVYPTVEGTDLTLRNTELVATFYDEEGKVLGQPYSDYNSYGKEDRIMTVPQPISNDHPQEIPSATVPIDTIPPAGINIDGKVQHSIVFHDLWWQRSGWQQLTLKLELYPIVHEEAPIPGHRTKVSFVKGRQPVLNLEIPFEMKF